MKKIALLLTALLWAFLITTPAFANTNETLNTIQNSISSDPNIGAHDVKIYFRHGVVMLDGDVDSVATADQIVQVAANTPRVERVNSYLIVAPQNVGGTTTSRVTQATMSDTEIRAQLETLLDQQSGTTAKGLDIEVENGNVSIAGNRGSFKDIDHILATTLNIRGVNNIENNMTVNGKPYPTSGFTG